jgi:hypothetical protein
MANAKKKHTRKVAKKYELVTFETPIYDGEFTFPAQKHMPQKLMIAMGEGELSKLRDWLIEAGADESDVEAFLDLDSEEAGQFIEAWGNGQLANAPKSQD